MRFKINSYIRPDRIGHKRYYVLTKKEGDCLIGEIQWEYYTVFELMVEGYSLQGVQKDLATPERLLCNIAYEKGWNGCYEI